MHTARHARTPGGPFERLVSRSVDRIRVSNLGTLLILLVLGLLLAGFRILIVQSDSMAPSLRSGDIIVTRLQPAGTMAPGDIVSYKSTGEDLITHRVISAQATGTDIDVITSGDAIRSHENWSVPADGTVGVLQFRIPRLGWLVGWALTAEGRFVATLTLASVIGVLVIREIWTT